jgi:hypothetical protein
MSEQEEQAIFGRAFIRYAENKRKMAAARIQLHDLAIAFNDLGKALTGTVVKVYGKHEERCAAVNKALEHRSLAEYDFAKLAALIEDYRAMRSAADEMEARMKALGVQVAEED